MKTIVTTCAGRETFAEYLIERIPDLIVNYDDFEKGRFRSTGWDNLRRSWAIAGDDPAIQLEDDIILCANWHDRIHAAIAERPNDVIQFFSMRKADIEVGSRYVTGSKFMMCQCFYIPAGMGRDMYEDSATWIPSKEHEIIPSDIYIADYLRRRRIRYWNYVPSLVDHRVARSAADPRRSSKRQSLTFREDY